MVADCLRFPRGRIGSWGQRFRPIGRYGRHAFRRGHAVVLRLIYNKIAGDWSCWPSQPGVLRVNCDPRSRRGLFPPQFRSDVVSPRTNYLRFPGDWQKTGVGRPVRDLPLHGTLLFRNSLSFASLDIFRRRDRWDRECSRDCYGKHRYPGRSRSLSYGARAVVTRTRGLSRGRMHSFNSGCICVCHPRIRRYIYTATRTRRSYFLY